MQSVQSSNASAASPKPVVALLLPNDIRSKVFSPDAEERLASMVRIVSPSDDQLTKENIPALLDGAVAAISGWGTPPFPDEVFSSGKELAFIAHSAGSIHRLQVSEAIKNDRIRVSHAAVFIAEAVAEFVLAQILSHLRRPCQQDADLKSGMNASDVRQRNLGRILSAQTVGIIGAGYVGRLVIRLLNAFNAQIVVYDPYLAPERAREMGVEMNGLDDLIAACDIVSLHAPVLPETRHMMGAEQFAKMRDGTLFINTARSALIDETAFLAALEQDRFKAAIDVFDIEPLPIGSPFRSLPNVYLSPHSAGHTIETYFRQGAAAVDEVDRFLKGQPLRYEVTKNMLATMA
ncbi:MAG: hydroxyacid dehydrogenase [Pseudomonadota bacterium]